MAVGILTLEFFFFNVDYFQVFIKVVTPLSVSHSVVFDSLQAHGL